MRPYASRSYVIIIEKRCQWKRGELQIDPERSSGDCRLVPTEDVGDTEDVGGTKDVRASFETDASDFEVLAIFRGVCTMEIDYLAGISRLIWNNSTVRV